MRFEAFVILLIVFLLFLWISSPSGSLELLATESRPYGISPASVKSKIIIFPRNWTTDDTKKNPDYLFIYGDNDQQLGYGGQAVIRDQTNAMGIPTKKTPDMDEKAFYTDAEFADNKKKIDTAIQLLVENFHLKKYKALVLPSNGLGTGLSRLNTNAPKTFAYLREQIHQLPEKIDF